MEKITTLGIDLAIIDSKCGLAAMNGSSIGVGMAPGLTALMRMPGERSGDYKSSDAKSAGNTHSVNVSYTKPSKYEAKSP